MIELSNKQKEALRAVRTIVVHGNCPDGLASALILDDVLPHREIIFAIHKVTQLEVRPNVLFCDYCPPEDQAEAFRAAGAIVLDHHKTARRIVESFEHHAFGDEEKEPGVSGAVLAFRHVWEPLETDLPKERRLENWNFGDSVRRFATLAGIRDTWLRSHPDWEEACAQAEMLLFFPWEQWTHGIFGRLDVFSERMCVGRISYQRKLESSKHLAKRAYIFNSKAAKVAVVPSRYISDVADLVDADLSIGFSYVVEEGQPRLLLSTRSRGSYDASAFCRFYQGGGHTHAAGCSVLVGEGAPDPFTHIRMLLEQFEAKSVA